MFYNNSDIKRKKNHIVSLSCVLIALIYIAYDNLFHREGKTQELGIKKKCPSE